MQNRPAPAIESAVCIVGNEIKEISLSSYVDNFVLLFFHQLNSNVHELISHTERILQYNALNCQVFVVTNESQYAVLGWKKMNRVHESCNVPIICDYSKVISKKYNVLQSLDGTSINALFLIDPAGIIRHMALNGDVLRSADETIRILKVYQQKVPENCDNNDADDDMTHIKYHLDRPAILVASQQQHQLSILYNAFTRFLYNHIGAPINTACSSVTTSYSLSLVKYPLVTKAITGGGLAVTANLIDKFRKAERINAKSILCTGLYGVAASSVYHYWYKLLDYYIINRDRLPSEITSLLKLLLDQLLMTPAMAVFTVGFYKYMDSSSNREWWVTMKATYALYLLSYWKKYLVLQGINFMYVKQQYRVLYADVIRLFWNVFLSTSFSQ